jgi:hypothetical protein
MVNLLRRYPCTTSASLGILATVFVAILVLSCLRSARNSLVSLIVIWRSCLASA